MKNSVSCPSPQRYEYLSCVQVDKVSALGRRRAPNRDSVAMKHTLHYFIILPAMLCCLDSAVAQTNWTQLSPSGGPPQARYGHTAVLNAANGRMIVFGGVFGTVGAPPLGNDVWILQDARTNGGNTWQQLTISGAAPSKRGFHSAAYDQANNRMMIFGGDPSVGYCFADVNDMWVLTNADGSVGTAGWTQLSPTGAAPSIRSFASAIYDPTGNRMIIYGGNEQCDGPDSDLWVLTNANGLGGTPGWIQLSASGGGPGPRTGHEAMYDAAHNRMILFGGQAASSLTNDTWVLSNANGLGGTATWTELAPAGPLPLPRSSFVAAYDAAMNTMVVVGGSSSAGYTNDVWVLSNANGRGGAPAWTQVMPGGPFPAVRGNSSLVEIPGAGRLVIFDGVNSSGIENDVWALQYANPGPTLNIASAGHNQSVLFWSASATNYVLQSTTNASSSNWVTVSNGAPIIGFIVTNTSPATFFRLQQQ